MAKPTIPQGTRDFAEDTVRKRNFIFNTIKSVFELHGFQPLETPAMENIETLMGKYGDEGDKLIFRILNNGLNDPKNKEKATLAFENLMNGKNDRDLTERALRYDLTIPFARFVAMNHGQLTFPYKRYQIQPVWRADKPQKSRYREFYQCDADVVGSKSLLNEVELVSIYSQVFRKLNINVTIKINSRKILTALAELCGSTENLTAITVAIDKLDKIGLARVKEELVTGGLNDQQINIIDRYLSIDGTNDERMKTAADLFADNENGKAGLQELKYVLSRQSSDSNVQIDFTLARGLNYYTGIIFEVKANDVQIGSIGGGGRYDDLTGLFGVPNIPGVGISFGVDRIYDVMEALECFPPDTASGTKVLLFNLGENEERHAYDVAKLLRANNLACEIYHESTKFDKQFRYADRKKIPYILIMGSKEIEEGVCQIKDLRKGEQTTVKLSELANFIFE